MNDLPEPAPDWRAFLSGDTGSPPLLVYTRPGSTLDAKLARRAQRGKSAPEDYLAPQDRQELTTLLKGAERLDLWLRYKQGKGKPPEGPEVAYAARVLEPGEMTEFIRSTRATLYGDRPILLAEWRYIPAGLAVFSGLYALGAQELWLKIATTVIFTVCVIVMLVALARWAGPKATVLTERDFDERNRGYLDPDGPAGEMGVQVDEFVRSIADRPDRDTIYRVLGRTGDEMRQWRDAQLHELARIAADIDDLQLVSNEAAPETREAAEQVRVQLSADLDAVEAELAAMRATVGDYVGQVEQFTADVDDSVRRSDADADSREALERIRRRRLGGR